jgi:hypothetical protein
MLGILSIVGSGRMMAWGRCLGATPTFAPRHLGSGWAVCHKIDVNLGLAAVPPSLPQCAIGFRWLVAGRSIDSR